MHLSDAYHDRMAVDDLRFNRGESVSKLSTKDGSIGATAFDFVNGVPPCSHPRSAGSFEAVNGHNKFS